jgi:hypothetical protein
LTTSANHQLMSGRAVYNTPWRADAAAAAAVGSGCLPQTIPCHYLAGWLVKGLLGRVKQG